MFREKHQTIAGGENQLSDMGWVMGIIILVFGIHIKHPLNHQPASLVGIPLVAGAFKSQELNLISQLFCEKQSLTVMVFFSKHHATYAAPYATNDMTRDELGMASMSSTWYLLFKMSASDLDGTANNELVTGANLNQHSHHWGSSHCMKRIAWIFTKKLDSSIKWFNHPELWYGAYHVTSCHSYNFRDPKWMDALNLGFAVFDSRSATRGWSLGVSLARCLGLVSIKTQLRISMIALA